MERRLTRSRDDRMIAGVAGGLADYLDIDPSIVRVVWALLVFAWGLGLLLYIVMAIVVPEEDAVPDGQPWAAPGATDPATGATDPAAASAASAREARRAARRARRGDEGRTIAILGGALLVLIGVAFLLRELVPAIDFDFFWPLVLVVLGIVIVVAALRPGGRSGSGTRGGGPT